MKRGFVMTVVVPFAVGISFLLGCGSPPAAPGFLVKFRIVSDDGTALPGVMITGRGQPIGRTNDRGEVDARIDGTDGEKVAVRIECGSAYVDPEHAPALKLTETRRITSRPNTPNIFYDALCKRRQRNVVIVARADKLVGVPVTVEGKQVALTDENGNAHALLPIEASVGSLHVGFDTAARPELLPKDPGRVFELGSGDDIVTIEQKFSTAPKPVQRRSVPAHPKHIPIRLD